MLACEQLRIATAETVGFETFEGRLRAAVAEAYGQIVGPDQFCAWAKVK